MSSSSLAESSITIPSPTLTEASSSFPSTTPPGKLEPAFTIINDPTNLKKFLDVLGTNLTLLPKLYSKAHCFPQTNETYTRTRKQSKILTESCIAPPALFSPPTSAPELYVDAEGISLGRAGELSILIVHVETAVFSHTYLLQVHVLGSRTFRTKTTDGIHTLKTILEDNRVPKVLFDCRMDSDALFGQFGVLLGGVIDLQLMCLAAERGGGRGLPGLEACLRCDLELRAEERAWVSEAKARGQLLWRPSCHGSMQRFNDNPLHEDIVNYCVVDAAYLPRLFETYNQYLDNRVSVMAVDTLWGNEHLEGFSASVFSWECRVLADSRYRVKCALDPNFSGGTGYNHWYEEELDPDAFVNGRFQNCI